MSGGIASLSGFIVLTCFAVGAVELDDSAKLKQDLPLSVDGPTPIILGVVVDPDGKPVEGADVACACSPAEFKPLTARTKADGKFRFELPPKDAKSYWAITYAGKAGFAPASKGQDAFAGDQKGKEQKLELRKAGIISGTVRDQAGKPVAGAKVQYGSVSRQPNSFSYGYPASAVFAGTPAERYFVSITDAHGRFQFTTVPADLELIFRVTADGMADLDVAYDWAMAMHFAKPGDPPVALVMEAGARIRGRVVSKVAGVPVAGMRIGVQGVNPRGIWKDARTDADGRFIITGLGSHNVNVFPTGNPKDAMWTARAAQVTPRPGKEVEAVIEVIEGVIVEGRIVTSDAERPAPGVGVGMYGPAAPETGAAILSATTDAQGRYRFRLPPGETYFYICGETPSFKRLPDDSSNRRVTIPEDAKTFTVPTIHVQKIDR